MVKALKLLHQARHPEHLRVKAFDRQVKDGEIRGKWRGNVLAGNAHRFTGDGLADGGCGFIHQLLVRPVLGGLQSLVILQRELGVNGQMDDDPILPPRKADGKLHPLGAARLDRDVCVKLGWRQRFIQQHAQLRFTPGAAGLDIAEHPLQIAHAAGQGLHLPQPLVHSFQAVIHQGKTLAQAAAEGLVQVLVHGLAHFIQLRGIVLAHLGKGLKERVPHFRHFLVILPQTDIEHLIQVLQPLPLDAKGAVQPLVHPVKPAARGCLLGAQRSLQRVLVVAGIGSEPRLRILDQALHILRQQVFALFTQVMLSGFLPFLARRKQDEKNRGNQQHQRDDNQPEQLVSQDFRHG